MELLSPAGTLECGIAAFQYGADAVYLGMKDFSARADAGNFSFEDLSILTGIAHENPDRPRKVYVAVNTLMHESELPVLIRQLALLQDAGIDALIVQDAAVVQLVREHFPNLELHASTQMAVHNKAGVIQAKQEGFTRVVAARELSIRELADMASVEGMEIEAFIHGALCYSYSGLCLMSACLNGESGNRGSCTYVCRNKFDITDKDGHKLGTCCPFSMKDLALGELLPDMKRAGVASLKIEGRKKTPLYVAAVTNYYRKLLDGTFKKGEEQQAELDVKTIFSRPWTNLFAKTPKNIGVTDTLVVGPRGIEAGQVSKVRNFPDGDHLRFVVKTRPIEKHDGLQVEIPGMDRPYGFGINEIYTFSQAGQDRWESVFVANPGLTVEIPLPDGHPDIPIGCRIFCASSQNVKQKYNWPEARPSIDKRRIPVNFAFTASKDDLSIKASAELPSGIIDNIQTSLHSDTALSPAMHPEKTMEDIKKCLERLGDTDFTLAKLDISNPDSLYIPKSLLNELRRLVSADLAEAIEAKQKQNINNAIEKTINWRPEKTEAKQTSLSLKTDRLFMLNAFDKADISTINELTLALNAPNLEEIESQVQDALTLLGKQSRIRLSLPVLMRAYNETKWPAVIKALFDQGWKKWEIGNIGAWNILKESGCSLNEMDICADWSLYAMNTQAARHLLEAGASSITACPEDLPENLKLLASKLGNKFTIPVYQDTVLARSAVCAMSSIKGFCPGKPNCVFTSMDLVNRRGDTLHAVNDNCTTIILNGTPADLSDLLPELRQAGASAFRLDFLWRNHAPVEVAHTWRRFQKITASL